MDNNFPKYQYSYFLKNGSQIVVRENDYSLWLEAINNAQEDFPIEEQKIASRPTTATQNTNLCSIHNTPLKDKVSKAGKPYKAHYRKVGEEWDVCFGKGWQSEIQGESSKQIGERL